MWNFQWGPTNRDNMIHKRHRIFGRVHRFLPIITPNMVSNLFIRTIQMLYQNRLEAIYNDSFHGVFTSKDSFLWFTLFDKFRGLGIADARFADFIDTNRPNQYLLYRNTQP